MNINMTNFVFEIIFKTNGFLKIYDFIRKKLIYNKPSEVISEKRNKGCCLR